MTLNLYLFICGELLVLYRAGYDMKNNTLSSMFFEKNSKKQKDIKAFSSDVNIKSDQ